MPDGVEGRVVFAEFATVRTKVRIVTDAGDVFAPGSAATVIDADPALDRYWIDFGDPIDSVVAVHASQIAPE